MNDIESILTSEGLTTLIHNPGILGGMWPALRPNHFNPGIRSTRTI